MGLDPEWENVARAKGLLDEDDVPPAKPSFSDRVKAQNAARPKKGTQTVYRSWPAVVPVPPSSNNMFVNVRGTGRVKSKEYTKWLGIAIDVLKPWRQPLTYPVSLVFVIREPLRANSDATNRIKAVEDALVSAGVIQNDNVKHVSKVSIEYAPGEHGGGVAIWVHESTE